jgi:hypothetical protein
MLEFKNWGPQTLRPSVFAVSYAFMLEIEGKNLCMIPVTVQHGSQALLEIEGKNLCMISLSLSSKDVDVAFSDSAQWIPPEHEVFRVLVEGFKQIPQVKSICAQFGNEEVVIWTLLDKYDREAREKVYEKEMEVCQRLGIYDFDFRVTSAQLVPPSELVRAGSCEIYKRP